MEFLCHTITAMCWRSYPVRPCQHYHRSRCPWWCQQFLLDFHLRQRGVSTRFSTWMSCSSVNRQRPFLYASRETLCEMPVSWMVIWLWWKEERGPTIATLYWPSSKGSLPSNDGWSSPVDSSYKRKTPPIQVYTSLTTWTGKYGVWCAMLSIPVQDALDEGAVVLVMIALIDCNNFYASCERLFRTLV